MEASATIQCQGCERECEVEVVLRDGQPVCLGGNLCPTGESYALRRCRHLDEEKGQGGSSSKHETLDSSSSQSVEPHFIQPSRRGK